MHIDQSIGTRAEAILSEAWRIMSSALPMVTGYLLFMTTFGVLIDTEAIRSSYEFLINLLGIAAAYVLLVAFIRNSEMAPEGLRAGFGTYFGLGILSGLAVVIGIILLIIPGLVLIVRWSPIYGHGMIEGRGVSTAMGESWDMTAKHFWPIALAYLPTLGLMILGMAIFLTSGFSAGWLESEGTVPLSLPLSILGNLAVFVATALSSAIGLATYSLLTKQDRVEDVFT